MKLSEIRTQLVAQHAALRQLASEVDAEAARVAAGASVEPLRALLGRFDEALLAHNRDEESLLRDEIRTIDAWGPQREALMDESHEAEHASLQRSLQECVAHGDPHEVARHGVEAVRQVLGHMAAEEKDILHPDLLRDDIVTIAMVAD